jgi:hypothetical protein
VLWEKYDSRIRAVIEWRLAAKEALRAPRINTS